MSVIKVPNIKVRKNNAWHSLRGQYVRKNNTWHDFYAIRHAGNWYGLKNLAPSANLWAEYLFDVLNHDSSGNERHTSLSNVSQTSDRNGQQSAVYLTSSSNSVIDIPENPVMDNYTISFWMYPTSKYGSSGSMQAIYSETSGSSASQGTLIGFSGGNSNRKIKVYEYEGDGTGHYNPPIEGNTQLPINAWTMVTIVFKQSEYIRIYINGSNDGTYTGDYQKFTGTFLPRIGNDRYGYYDRNYQGKLDDFRIYTESLTADQVAFIYNQS